MKDYFFIREKGNIVKKIIYKDISHIEAMGDYCKIFTEIKTHIVHCTLSHITSVFPQNIFYRCHRSFTINIDRVEMIEDYTAFIGKNNIPIGEQYKSRLLSLLNLVN